MPVSASLGPGSSSWCRTRGTLSKDLRTGVMRSSTESSEQDKQAALPWQTWIAGPLEARSSSLINTVTHILLLKPSPPLPSWPGQITSERLLLSTLITLVFALWLLGLFQSLFQGVEHPCTRRRDAASCDFCIAFGGQMQTTIIWDGFTSRTANKTCAPISCCPPSIKVRTLTNKHIVVLLLLLLFNY